MSERRSLADGLMSHKGKAVKTGSLKAFYTRRKRKGIRRMSFGEPLVSSVTFPWNEWQFPHGRANPMLSRTSRAPQIPGRGGTAFLKFPAWAHGGAGEPWRKRAAGLLAGRSLRRAGGTPEPRDPPSRGRPVPRSGCEGVCVCVCTVISF